MHEGGYTLDRVGRDGLLRFRRPDGRVVPAVPPPLPGRTHELERRHREGGLEIRPDTCASRWLGERLDLPLVIDALVVNDARLSE